MNEAIRQHLWNEEFLCGTNTRVYKFRIKKIEQATLFFCSCWSCDSDIPFLEIVY